MPKLNSINTLTPEMGKIDYTTATPGAGNPYSSTWAYSGTAPYGGRDMNTATPPENDTMLTYQYDN